MSSASGGKPPAAKLQPANIGGEIMDDEDMEMASPIGTRKNEGNVDHIRDTYFTPKNTTNSNSNTTAEIFVAIAIPLNNRGLADVFFSMNFEASYSLPQNQTRFVFPPLITDTVTRKFVYNMLETNMQSYGVPGKECLQRAICEAAEYTPEGTGVLGDLLHVLLTPSSSKDEETLVDYGEAEQYGKTRKHCKRYAKKCALSVLNLISNLKRNKIY